MALCLFSCGPPEGPEEDGGAGSGASAEDLRDLALPPPEILWVLDRARDARSAEMLAIALALPPGGRDRVIGWLLDCATSTYKGSAIAALDVPEVVRLRPLLRECARSTDPRERDPALHALARAGEIDVLPLLMQALRTEASEASLAALADAAAELGTLAPFGALLSALEQARTTPALVALTRALGPGLDATAVSTLAARGPAGAPALALAVRLLKTPRPLASWESVGLTPESCRRLLDGAADPRNAPELARLADRGLTRFALERMLGGEAVDEAAPPPEAAGPCSPAPASSVPPVQGAMLRARAAELIARDAALGAAAVASLSWRIRSRAPDSESSVRALGTIATPEAVAALATALFELDGAIAAAASRSLARALRVGPTGMPEDPDELRRRWRPILETLAPR